MRAVRVALANEEVPLPEPKNRAALGASTLGASKCVHLSPELAAATLFAFLTAWRLGETINLQRSDVDFSDRRTVMLDGIHSKNKKGREFKMTAGLRGVLEERLKEHERLKRDGRICLFVFNRETMVK